MISCQQYDYIEIACMYRYPITLTLHSGAKMSGTAMDTVQNSQKEECIKIVANHNEQLIVLSKIKTLKAERCNPHFHVITF